MPNHDRFECQTAIDSDAILQRFHYVFIDGYWKVMYRTPEGWKMKALALALRRCPK